MTVISEQRAAVLAARLVKGQASLQPGRGASSSAPVATEPLLVMLDLLPENLCSV